MASIAEDTTERKPLSSRTFKKRWATALFSRPDKPMGAVAMGFKLYMEMDSSGCGAVISDREFSDCCGVSERACQNFKKWLLNNSFVRIQVKGARGRANAFMAIIPGEEMTARDAVIQQTIAASITGREDECQHPLPAKTPEMPATRAVISQMTAPNAGNPCSSRTPAPAQMESSLREDKSLEDNNKSPLSPQADEVRVTFEKGRLQLFNGLEQFWLKEFGDAKLLDLALMQAAGYVQPNSFKPLEAQVSSQLARLARDKRDKDARYAKAVKANGKGGSKRLSLDELSEGVDAAFERQFAEQSQQAKLRLTHER